MLKIIFAYLFILITLTTFAGNDSLKNEKFPVLDFYVHGGTIIRNYDPLPSANPTFIAEVFIASAANGAKAWHSHYRYPQVGLSLFFADFGNKKILGQGMSVMPSFIFKHGNISKFYGELKLGFGLTFFTTHFNANTNPENVYIGSVATLASFASLDVSRRITEKIYLKAGVSFFHFSNGHYQLPNIGMNIPCLNVGVKYLPNKMPLNFKGNSITEYDKRLSYTARFGFGLHEMGYAAQSAGGPKYPVYTVTTYTAKRITAINNIQAGFFINYYTSFYDYITTENVFASDPKLKATTATVFVGHEFIAGHFGFVAETGITVYNPFRKKYAQITLQKATFENFLKRWSGNKFGVQYYPVKLEKSLKNKLYLGVYLKTNFDQADFVEAGLGYTF